MSWFGGLNDSFSQITEKAGQLGGQISTFTKEVLAEDGNELAQGSTDKAPAPELQHASTEALIRENHSLKHEVNELKSIIHKLEIEANTSAVEYEARQQAKQKEINQLKEQLGQYGKPPPSTTDAGDMHLDEYSDVLSAQREINRLLEELHQSKDENQKLKKLAEEIKLQRSLFQSNDHTKRIEELESELKREIQHHVQEVQSLQDAHNATSAKQVEEIRKLKQQLKTDGDASVTTESLDQSERSEHLKTENDELKEKLRTKNRQLLLQKKKLEALTSNLDKLKQQNEELKKKEEEHSWTPFAEILNLFSNSSELSTQEAVAFIKSNISELIHERDHLNTQQANHIDEIRRLNQRLDETNHQRAVEVDEQIALAESDQHAHEFNSTAEEDRNQDGNLEAESDQYQQHMHIGIPINQSSPRRVAMHDLVAEGQQQQPGDLTLTLQALRKQVEDYEVEIAQFDSIQSEWQQEKISLQSLLDRYQAEINNAQQHEQYSSDVPEDDRAASVTRLKQELVELREMRTSLENDKTRLSEEKEQFQTAARNLEDELNMSVADNQVTRDEVDTIKSSLLQIESEKTALQKALDALNDKMNQSIVEKEETDKALEELDTQHQQEINQMLKIRDDFAQEVKQLQKKLDEEMDNKNHILQGIEELKQHLAQKMNETDESNRMLQDESEQLKLELQDAQMKNEELQKMMNNAEYEMMNISSQENDELKNRLKYAESELNESSQRESKLEEDLQRLREEIEENLKENEQLIQEIKIMEEKCTAQEEQIRELKTTPSEEILRKMEDIKVIHEQEVEDLREEYENTLKEKFAQAQNLEVRFGALEREKKKINDQLQEFVLKCEELETQKESLKTQMQALEVKKEEEALVQKSNDVNEEKQRLLEEIGRLESDLEEMGTEMENSGKEMAQVQNQHQEEMEKLKEDHLHEIQALKHEHEKDVEELREEMVESKGMFECEKRLLNQSHQEEIEKINLKHEEDVNVVKTEHSVEEKEEHAQYEMKRRIETLGNEKGMLEKEIEQCRETIKSLEELKQNATDERKINVEKIEAQYLNEVQKLQQMLEEEATKLKEHEEYFDKSMRESAEKHAQEVDGLHTKLQDALDVKKSEVTELRTRLTSVEDQTHTLLQETEMGYVKEMHLMKDKVVQAENKIAEVMKQLNDAETELTESRDKLVTSGEELEKLKTEKTQLENNFANYKSEMKESHKTDLQRVQETSDGLESENRRLNNEIEVLNQTKIMHENLLKSEQSEHEKMQDLQNCIKEKDDIILTLKAEFEKKEANLMKRIQEETMRLEEDIQTLGDELENTGKQIVEMETKHKNEMNLVVSKHENSTKELVDKYNNTVVELDNKNKKLLQLQNNLEENSTLFDETTTALENKVLELQEKLNVESDAIKEGSDLKNALEKQLRELTAEKDALNQQLLELKQQLETQVQDVALKNEEITKKDEQHVAEVVLLRETIEQLTEDTNKLKLSHASQIDTLQQELQRMSAECENNEVLRVQLEADCNNLQSKLNTVNAEFVSCQEKLKELEAVHQSYTGMQNGGGDVISLRDELEQCKSQYEEKLSKLTSELKNIKMNDSGKKEPGREDVDKMLEEIRRRDISGLEKADLSKEHIGSLLSLIKERDEVINLLYSQQQSQEKNEDVALVKKLENEKKSLTMEKEQILAVVSEKTRENRKLKDEVHKMMDVIGAGKTALAKVQQENKELVSRYDGYDPEMTKDAVTKLSQLVRERELEVESLQQKCNTLLEVLQQTPQQGTAATAQPMDSMVSGQQVQALLKDKEELTEKLKQLTVERDHLVALVNQKQVEIDELRMTAQAAANDLEHDAHNNSKLQIDFGNLVHEYEQTQMKLSTVQKELTRFKETANHLEESKELLLSKIESYEHGAVQVAQETLQQQQASIFNEQDFAILQEKLEKKSESLHQKDILLKDASEKLQKKDVEMERLSNDMREKDILIHNQLTEIQRLTKELNVRSNEVSILRKSVENLREQIAAQTKTAEDCRQETKNLSSKYEEKQSEAQAFQETNTQLSMMLKEKEYELEMLRDKTARLESSANQQREGQETHTSKLTADLDLAQQQLMAVQHERDQLMVNLKQNHLESSKYSEEAKELREKEHRLESELARLRNHLIQVEESNTQEALLYAESEEHLKQQLSQAISSHSAANEASEHSLQQIESLQEQLRVAQQQRDNANAQCQLSQEQSTQYSNALQTLQVAVEQMQREDAANHQSEREKQLVVIREKEEEVDGLKQHLHQLKNELAQTAEILESASRLNEQLELKERSIDQLKTIVSEKQLQVEELLDKLHQYSQKHESMVDKEIIKNLFIGYFSTTKQNDVIKLITSVLDFTEDEIKQVQPGGWISGWMPSWRGEKSRSVPVSPRDNARAGANGSFSQMFVKFLETESTPHALAKLPAASMVSEAQQRMSQRKIAGTTLSSVPTPVHDSLPRVTGTIAGRYNPFTSSTSTPDKKSSSAMLSGTSHPLIMQPLTPILPTFGGQHMGKEILQDVLKSNAAKPTISH